MFIVDWLAIRFARLVLNVSKRTRDDAEVSHADNVVISPCSWSVSSFIVLGSTACNVMGVGFEVDQDLRTMFSSLQTKDNSTHG